MGGGSVSVTIYHNPACGRSRNTLGLIRNAGIEPTVIEYLETPPSRARLKDLLESMGLRPRELLREKGTPGLGAEHWTDEQLLEQMLAYPILINRPIVVTPWECGYAVHPRPSWRSSKYLRGVPPRRRTESEWWTIGAIGYADATSVRPLACAPLEYRGQLHRVRSPST